MRTLGWMLVTVVFCIGFCGIVLAADMANVVITVNGMALTEGDLSEEIQKIAPMETSFHSGISPERMVEIRKKALASLEEKELQYQDALVRGMGLSKDEISLEFDKFKEQFKGAGDFNKLMSNTGFTETSLKRLLERRILKDRVKQQMVDDKIRITDQMIQDYYAKNKSRYLKPKEFKASHILIKVDPSLPVEEKTKLRDRAEMILQRLKGGADFAATAGKESDDLSSMKGGSLRPFHLGQTEPQFEDAVKSLKPGEISGIVETLYGFHIIKLDDVKEQRQMLFDEVKDKIRANMREEESKRLYRQWMDGLKEKAKIVYPVEG
jgi:parvulin-like peptidyl-prolyl isomerase